MTKLFALEPGAYFPTSPDVDELGDDEAEYL
jgi:hypothetical protein